MNFSKYNETDMPINLEALIEDSVRQILVHEDPQRYIAWMREHIHDYYTGSGQAGPQTALFTDEIESKSSTIHFTPELARALAVTIAESIWNGMPLPSNHFKPRPIPAPKRNDPCHCGSGKKYKQCCANLPPIPALDQSEIWPVIFDQLDKDVAARAIRENHIPVGALCMIADDYLMEDRPKKAASLLEPLFEGKIRKTNEDADYALNLLCNIYDSLGFDKKKNALISSIIETAPRSPLRSGAWQRISTIRMDMGDVEGAWDAFQKAQRDDPGSLSLSVLEVQILHAQRNNDKAKERAGFWVRKLRRAGLDDDEMPLSFLIEVARNPVKAFTDLGLEITGDAGQLLKQWLDDVAARPLPFYSISSEVEPVDLAENGGLETMRTRLRSQGMNEEQVEQALHDLKNQMSEIEDDDEENNFPMPDDNSMILKAPQTLHKLEKNWHAIFPLEKPFSVNQTPFEGADPWDFDEEARWSAWLNKNPQAYDSIDILDDLVTALLIHPQVGATWLDDTFLKPILLRVEAITEKALKASGNPQLYWLHTENRPALRSLARLITMELMENNETEAIMRERRLIEINPNDNHGFRQILVNQLLKRNENEEALKLTESYLNDMSPEIPYGRVLAFYRMGDIKEAVNSLGDAIESLPKIPRYLTAKRIRQPRLDPHGFIMGGDDQAWHYREEMRDEWLKTAGAIEWLKKAVKAYQ